MTSSTALDSLRRRAIRHAFEDGAIDLLAAFFTLVMAVGTQRPVFLALAVAYLASLGILWKSLHASLTSRRTGYAEVPGDPPIQLFGVILLAGCLTMSIVAAATLTTGRLWNLAGWPTWTPMLSGTILAGGLAVVWWQTGLWRYALLAALSLGSGLFFWLFPFGPGINPSDRLTLSLFVTAAVLLIVGAVTIARFVRSRPILESEELHAD